MFSSICEALDRRSNIKAANFDRHSMQITKAKSARLASLSSPAYLSQEAQTLAFTGKGLPTKYRGQNTFALKLKCNKY